MIKDVDMFDFSYYPTDHKLYKMGIVGKDEQGKNIIHTCKVPGKCKEDNSSHVCEKLLHLGLSHMLKNLFLLLMRKVKVIHSIGNGKGAPSHLIQNRLHYNMHEESLFKKEIFENKCNAILSVSHEVNTYSMKKYL